MKKRPVTQIADLFVIGGIGGFKKCFSKFWLTVVASEFDIKYLYIYMRYMYMGSSASTSVSILFCLKAQHAQAMSKHATHILLLIGWNNLV